MLSGHTFLHSRTIIYENHEDASAFVSLWYHADAPEHAGKGVVLLPNGWKIAPAGRRLPLDDLPLDMAESRDVPAGILF